MRGRLLSLVALGTALGAALGAAACRGDGAATPLADMPSPAPAGARWPHLAADDAGRVYLTWMEPGAAEALCTSGRLVSVTVWLRRSRGCAGAAGRPTLRSPAAYSGRAVMAVVSVSCAPPLAGGAWSQAVRGAHAAFPCGLYGDGLGVA